MMKPEPNEYILARRSRDGDRHALAELTQRLRARLFGIAYAELRHFEDAQDAVAVALLNVCQGIGSLRQPERLRAWADSIARNEARRLASRRNHVLPLSEGEEVDLGADEVEALVLRLDIEAALRRLPAVHDRVLTLFYLDGQPIAQIAAQTQQPEGTVKSWLHHGRKNLAHILQEYAPMTTPNMTEQPQHEDARIVTAEAAPRKAVLVHSDLTPEKVSRVIESLKSRGYETHVPDGEEYGRLKQVTEAADYSVLTQWIGQFAVIVLDETIEGHSALEHVINLRYDSDWNHVLIYVLMSATPSSYTASAYFNAGVSGLIFKDGTSPNASTLEFSDQRTVILWQRFTERARRVVLRAEDEAKRLGGNFVTTEHLLIGITQVPDCLGARLLSERDGVDLQALRQMIEKQITPGEGHDPSRPMELTPRCTGTIGLAQVEAQALGHSWLGAEHLLLGMLRQNTGTTAQVLTASSVTLEKTRGQVVEFLKR